MENSKISSGDFYREYRGHDTTLLQIVKDSLSQGSLVFLAGDSSLDSKYWFSDIEDAVNGYQDILEPPRMKKDISYCLNKLFAEQKLDYAVINTAVEESTLEQRTSNGLNKQDRFIRDNIKKTDILFVSVGGNDIALKPSLATIWNMIKLLMFEDEKSLVTKDLSSIWGIKHFIHLFRDEMTRYLQMLTEKTKPKKIIVSAIYFPDETRSGGWADNVLQKLSYYKNPAKLQAAIKAIFQHAISKIQLSGTEVVPFPMYEVLNGKDSKLYCSGVEPSALGNEALAQAVLPLITGVKFEDFK